MIVTSSRAGALSLPYSDLNNTGQQVHYNFVNGSNYIDYRVWNRIKSVLGSTHPFLTKQAGGAITLVEDTTETDSSGYASCTAAELVVLINQISRIGDLETILTAERAGRNSAAVISAVTNRIRVLKYGSEG